MKKILLFVFTIAMLISCDNGERRKNTESVAIFEIGDSRTDVINTIMSDFTIGGEQLTIHEVLDKLNFDKNSGKEWITLYECVYKGQEYYKLRVYFDLSDKVTRIELVIEKDKLEDMYQRLKSKYGEPCRISLPREIPGLSTQWEICTVYIGDIDGVIVTEDSREMIRTHQDGTTTSEISDVYELIVVTGEEYHELKSFM